jgi:hypothetical protein
MRNGDRETIAVKVRSYVGSPMLTAPEKRHQIRGARPQRTDTCVVAVTRLPTTALSPSFLIITDSCLFSHASLSIGPPRRCQTRQVSSDRADGRDQQSIVPDWLAVDQWQIHVHRLFSGSAKFRQTSISPATPIQQHFIKLILVGSHRKPRETGFHLEQQRLILLAFSQQ